MRRYHRQKNNDTLAACLKIYIKMADKTQKSDK